MLNYIRHDGPAERPPLLIAHGLFGSARNWGVIAKRLSDRRAVYCVDMRNHGASFWADSQSYEDMAEDLSTVIDHIGEEVDLMGHSMGGKAAMVLALSGQTALRRLIVADISPVNYAHSQMEPLEAMRAVDLTSVNRRSDAIAQLSQLDPMLQSFLTQSLDISERRWRLNLDVLARDMDKIMSFPNVSGQFSGPSLFLTGAASDYVLPEHRPQIKSLFPAAKFAKIPEAAHWLHADRPREFEAAARAFLDFLPA